MSITKIRVAVEDLIQGMYVAELDRPWLESPFLFQGFLLDSEALIAEVQEVCVFVYIDAEQSRESIIPQLQTLASKAPLQHGKKTGAGKGRAAADSLDYQAFSQHLRRARKSYDKTRTYIDQALTDVRLGISVDTAKAKELVSELADNIVHSPNAMVWLTHLKERDEYTSTHCMNVCILSLSFGRCLALSKEQLNVLGLGALLHDLGKMRVPDAILNKPGRLTAEEFEIMKRHPVDGHQLLCEDPHMPEDALDAVLHHHERSSGKGYPDKLESYAIRQLTKIVGIVDIYDAVTSDRCYHDGLSPYDGLNLMYKLAGENFDLPMIEQFIKCLGIYPIGSLVELNSGEVGIVLSANQKSRLRPIVMLILDANKKYYKRRFILNLAGDGGDQAGEQLEIEKILENQAYGINAKQIIEEESAP